MHKRRPYIAVLTLLIALVGVIWAIWTLTRFLYAPMEPISLADLPSDALDPPAREFSDIEPPGTFDFGKAVLIQPAAISWQPSVDRVFPILVSREQEYALKAKTRSAFDPVKDEQLRTMLRELLEIRQTDETTRLELALRLFDEIKESVGDSYFKSTLYELLMTETLNASFDNPELYPLKLAETKSGFYGSLDDEEKKKLQIFNELFKKAIVEKLNTLRQTQKNDEDKRIIDIKDYLVEKTSSIESTVQQDSDEENGESE